MMDISKRRINILYFAPCGLDEGVGGGARLRNMVSALEKLDIYTILLSYLPADKFEVVHRQVNSRLTTITISVRRSSVKLLKAFALMLVFTHGLRRQPLSPVFPPTFWPKYSESHYSLTIWMLKTQIPPARSTTAC
jgi:hypothetical protein